MVSISLPFQSSRPFCPSYQLELPDEPEPPYLRLQWSLRPMAQMWSRLFSSRLRSRTLPLCASCTFVFKKEDYTCLT